MRRNSNEGKTLSKAIEPFYSCYITNPSTNPDTFSSFFQVQSHFQLKPSMKIHLFCGNFPKNSQKLLKIHRKKSRFQFKAKILFKNEVKKVVPILREMKSNHKYLKCI